MNMDSKREMPQVTVRKTSVFKTKQQEQMWRFALAGISNICGATVTNPIDVIKVRMQIDNELKAKQSVSAISALTDRTYKGWLRAGTKIVADEGIYGLYKGLLPSVMREGIYSTIRLGAYEPMKEVFGATDPAHTPLYKKLAAGATSGIIGSSIATPTDLIKVRMQAEGALTAGQTPRYSSTFHAVQHIIKSEGVIGLYKGIGPTVKRAAILTATQIPAYDHTKHTILNAGLLTEGIPLHVISSMVAGFCTAFTTSPIDVIKTRVMNQQVKGGGSSEGITYRGTVDCFLKTLRSEGPLGFYKGFIPNWMRIGPHTIVTFFIFEQLRRAIGMRPV